MAEREGFEPSIRLTVYTLSRRAPSATRTPLQINLYIVLFNAFQCVVQRSTQRARYSVHPALRPSGSSDNELFKFAPGEFSQPL